MASLHTENHAGWGRVAVIAAVAVTAVWALVLISPGQELDSEAFLNRVYAQSAEVRSAHVTTTGAFTMSNGEVRPWSFEGAWVYTGDSRGHTEYEVCTLPVERDAYLCSSAWVEVGDVRYEKEDTSEGLGEWQIVDSAQTQQSDTATPYNPVEVLDRLGRRLGLVELKPEIVAGVKYRRFRGDYNPSRLMLELLEAGEWEPPAEVPVPREDMIRSLQQQAEVETGTIELWARADDSTIWRIITERDGLDASASEPFRYLLPRKSYEILEYSRYNEPVVIKPPI